MSDSDSSTPVYKEEHENTDHENTEQENKPERKPRIKPVTDLSFNVNAVRSRENSIKSYFVNHDVEKLPRLNNCHYLLTATIEKTLHYLVQRSTEMVNFDKCDLKTINRVVLRTLVETDEELKDFFIMHLNHFDSNLEYFSNLPVSNKEFKEYLDTKFPNVKLTPKGKNLLCYLLLKVYNDILRVLYLLVHSNIVRSIKCHVLVTALKTTYKDSQLCGVLIDEINRVQEMIANTKEEEDNDEEDEEDGDEKKDEDSDEGDDGEEEVEEVKEVKEKKKVKVKSKKLKVTKKKAEVIEQDDSSGDDGEDGDDEEEDEVEEVVVQNPKKKVKVKAKPKSDTKEPTKVKKPKKIKKKTKDSQKVEK